MVPFLFARKAVRRLMFRTISQTAIRYPSSPLSVGKAGRVRGGDRLPWVPFDDGDDNFTPLTSVDWQVHVYGEQPIPLAAACRQRGLALHVFPWRSSMRRAGLARNAAYLVRPDGHVALADIEASGATLRRYLDDRGLRERAGSPRATCFASLRIAACAASSARFGR